MGFWQVFSHSKLKLLEMCLRDTSGQFIHAAALLQPTVFVSSSDGLDPDWAAQDWDSSRFEEA